MSAPLVSVVMPVHNAAPYVAAAMRSVLEQTLRNLELIVVDDASTDQSFEIISAFTDRRIRLTRSAVQLNAAGARNLALAEARGEFVAFLDADDLADPDRLARQIQFLNRSPAVSIVASRVTLMDEGDVSCGTNFPPRPPEEIPSMLLFENCLALSSVTACRNDLQQFRPWLAPAEDYDLWARLAPTAGFSILPRPLTCYRLHSDSVSARDSEDMSRAVASIHAGQLLRLGFCETPPVHALLAKWPLNATQAQLAEAGAWLLSLLAANERHAVYPANVFRRVVAARWFAVCHDSWLLGWPVWNVYHQSPLAEPTLSRRLRLLRRLLPQRLRRR